jgi:putative nucleotide binding protein
MTTIKEEKCIILDFLASGYPDRRHTEPIAQAIGMNFFSLLELVPKQDVTLNHEEEVYIGEGKRDKISNVNGLLKYDELTNTAKSTLENVIEKLVKKNDKQITEFFNKSGMITPRMHQIQLLPGVGKKHLLDLLEERNKKPFENLKDLDERVKLFPDPIKTVARRVMNELKDNEKYYLFVKARKDDRRI